MEQPKERERRFFGVPLGIGGKPFPPWGMRPPGSRHFNKGPHRGNYERIALMRRKGFSIFVDNLPVNVNKKWIAQLFRGDGEIIDIFVSNKQRRNSSSKFGFVRYRKQEEMRRAIWRNDGLVINGKPLIVKQAIHNTRASKPMVNRSKMIWRTVNKVENHQQDKEQEEETRRTVRLPLVEDKIEWLKRSIVGMNSHPEDLEVIERKLRKDWPQIEAVRSLGNYKTIVTFDDKELQSQALTTYKDILLKHFEYVEAWSMYERAETKRVWVEIRGIPPQAWSAENFEKLIERWGRLVCLDEDTNLGKKLEVAKVLIDSNICSRIDELLYIQVGEIGVDLHMTEIRIVETKIQQTNRVPSPVNQIQEATEEDSSSTCPNFVKATIEDEATSKIRVDEQTPKEFNDDSKVCMGNDADEARCMGKSKEGINEADMYQLNAHALRIDSKVEKDSEETKVLLSDDRRTQEILGAFKTLPNYVPNTQDKDSDLSHPPGFGNWVGPITVEVTKIDSPLTQKTDEPLSTDDENSRDSIEFDITRKAGECGGIKIIETEKARKIIARLRKTDRIKGEEGSNKKSSKKEKKKRKKQKRGRDSRRHT